MAAHFEPVVNANRRLVAPPSRRTAIGGYPKIAFYDMLGEQLHYSYPVKQSDLGCNDCICSVVGAVNFKIEKKRQWRMETAIYTSIQSLNEVQPVI